MLYFLLHQAERFQRQLVPALAAAWRERSFAPCRDLHAYLRADVRAFHESIGRPGHDSLLELVSAGLTFDRLRWRELVGEVLLFGAVELPQFPTEPETLCCLLAPERYLHGPAPRELWSPIEQAHFGSQDLVFGSGYYRPEQAGWNDGADVERLRAYLHAIDPAVWSGAALSQHRDLAEAEERTEMLADLRAWFPHLQALYARAAEQRLVVVCEDL